MKKIKDPIQIGSVVLLDKNALYLQENSSLVGNELRRTFSAEEDANIENLIGVVTRIRNFNSRENYYDVTLSLRINNYRPETWQIHEKFLIHVCLSSVKNKSLNDFIKLNNSLELSNDELDFSDSEEIYPLKNRLTHGFLNDVDVEEFKRAFTTEELIEHLTRYSLCLSSLEERFNLIKQKVINNETSDTNNTQRNTEKPNTKRKAPKFLDVVDEQFLPSIEPVPEYQVGGRRFNESELLEYFTKEGKKSTSSFAGIYHRYVDTYANEKSKEDIAQPDDIAEVAINDLS